MNSEIVLIIRQPPQKAMYSSVQLTQQAALNLSENLFFRGRKRLWRYTNLLKSQPFIALHHNNAITTVELLQELIGLLKDVAEAKKRGDNQGMSEEELAFYDALATNDLAIDIMGDDALMIIASQLIITLRDNISVDLARRKSVRAKMRRDIKRTLNKYGDERACRDGAI